MAEIVIGYIFGLTLGYIAGVFAPPSKIICFIKELFNK